MVSQMLCIRDTLTEHFGQFIFAFKVVSGK